MALSANTVFEARSASGADTNGGGFVVGSGGTDRSQQDAAFASGTNLTVDATTNTDVTPDGHTPAAADVGNLIQITAGAGFTTGFYQIASIQSGKWRLDRSPAATGTSGGTWALGGALGAGAFGILDGVMVGSSKAYFKGTGFVESATTTWAQSVIPGSGTARTRLIGYGTTRGDGVKAKLTLQTNTGLTGISVTGNGFNVENIEVDCATLGTSTGISYTGQYGFTIRCCVRNFTTKGINVSGAYHVVSGCEVTGGTSAATNAVHLATGTSTMVSRCFIHTNACPGIVMVAGGWATRNIVANNSGASSDGIQVQYGTVVLSNTVHGNGRDGLRNTTPNDLGIEWLGNLFTSNGGYGLTASSGTALPAQPQYDGNAYWNNTSGARNLADNTTGIFGADPYTNTRDVTLTGSPYVGPTSGGSEDFGLNNTAGAGAAARASGIPGPFVAPATTIGYLDMGAVQHQDAGGGGGGAMKRAGAGGGRVG